MPLPPEVRDWCKIFAQLNGYHDANPHQTSAISYPFLNHYFITAEAKGPFTLCKVHVDTCLSAVIELTEKMTMLALHVNLHVSATLRTLHVHNAPHTEM